MNEDIKVTFIIPQNCRTEYECSEEMKLAFIATEQHSSGGLQAKWVKENQLESFKELTKRDVIVMTQFEGELYEKLRATKCLLVGPRCLSCCLTEGIAIPSGPEPVFTVAMRGLVVTASGLSKQQKENIKKKVHWMGGIYNTVLTDDTTHLVSDTVLSDKYIKSVEKQIPIMSETWIEAVWEASLYQNVSGSSPEFLPHKLPPFANLQVTTSAISKRDKQLIMKLVSENGGTFSGAFQSETTDIVVLNKDGVGSEKYKAALEYGKACVLPTWVKDSATAGVALPLAKYRVAGASTSSPLPTHSRLPDMSLNFSRITNIRPPNNFIDETRSTDVTTMSGRIKLSQDKKSNDIKSNDTSIEQEIVSAFENFDMSAIKKAGPIFDGFCIWVHGLTGTPRERASTMVSRCGGVRYDAAHERVTHVVTPRRSAAHAAQAAPHAVLLSPLWLLRSVEMGRPEPETEYLIATNPKTPAKSSRKANVEAASPMSKRNLQLLRRGPLELPPPAQEPQQHAQDELVNHYLSQQMPDEPPPKEKTIEPEPNMTSRLQNPDITEDITEEPTEEIEQIFRGMKIEVLGLDEEAIVELSAEVGAAGGVMCASGAGGTLVLVPLDYDVNEVDTRGDVVTVFWVKDCLCQQELLPIEYYHRPVKLSPFASGPPLQGVVASLSTYSGVERAFLDELAKLLGATTQLRFCRRNTANAVASTHLICPTPVGDKYAGAVKWGLPAVTAQWLLACAESGSRVSEKEYLVGETRDPPSPQKSVQEPCEKEIEIATNKALDKENEMLPPVGANVPKRNSIPKGETPKGQNATEDMSPASRYIAMARQGLLGGDSQESPKQQDHPTPDKQVPNEFRTPILEEGLSTLSPRTRRRLLAIQAGEMPSDPIRTPNDPFNQPTGTPDSGFGAALRPGGRLSPAGRKRLWSLVRTLPGKEDHEPQGTHTPLSEIRNRFLAQFNSDATTTPPSEHHVAPRKLHLQEQADTPPPSKIAKTSVEQSPSTAMRPLQMEDPPTPEGDEQKSVSSASSLPPAVDAQLQRLNAALAGRLTQRHSHRSRDSIHVPQVPDTEPVCPESQPNTVGWDDSSPVQTVTTAEQAEQTDPVKSLPPPVKRFMLSSNVDNREEIIEMIVYLGGEVSEGSELDPMATHLLCSAPGRSEKMLGSVAAGRWVLHPAYVARSRATGAFLPEEQFEWGNPAAKSLPPVTGAEAILANAAYRWRSSRDVDGPRPYTGLVALLHAPPPRAQLLRRLVVAGGGGAPDLQPPYTDDTITVCFADLKRFPLSPRDAAWLKSRKIPVCPPVLLSSYLTDDPPPDPNEHCIPEFRC